MFAHGLNGTRCFLWSLLFLKAIFLFYVTPQEKIPPKSAFREKLPVRGTFLRKLKSDYRLRIPKPYMQFLFAQTQTSLELAETPFQGTLSLKNFSDSILHRELFASISKFFIYRKILWTQKFSGIRRFETYRKSIYS